jgi:hypothetical protein
MGGDVGTALAARPSACAASGMYSSVTSSSRGTSIGVLR